MTRLSPYSLSPLLDFSGEAAASLAREAVDGFAERETRRRGVEDGGRRSLREGRLTPLAGVVGVGARLASPLRRASWALPSLVDVYARRSTTSDQAVGRAAAGLDPSAKGFATPPPRLKGSVAQALPSDAWSDVVVGRDSLEAGGRGVDRLRRSTRGSPSERSGSQRPASLRRVAQRRPTRAPQAAPFERASRQTRRREAQSRRAAGDERDSSQRRRARRATTSARVPRRLMGRVPQSSIALSLFDRSADFEAKQSRG